MNADCITSSTTSSPEATLAVCGDFSSSLSLTSSQKQQDKQATIQQEFSAFVPPIHKRFKGPYVVMAIAVSAVECTMTFLVFCLVIPALLIVSAILKIATYAVERYIAYTRNCIPLREDDAVWRQDRPSNLHIVNALMVIEGAPDIAKLRQIICDRLVYGKDEKGERICPMLPEWVSKSLIDFFSRKVSCVLSNVPGPQQAQYIGGQKIVQGIFWPPQRANIGMSLSIFSYSGAIRVGVCSDERVIPNPGEVAKGFEKNLQQLVNELNLNEK